VTTRASEIVFNKYNVEYSQNEVLYFDKWNKMNSYRMQ
jgi:hypothetical protein